LYNQGLHTIISERHSGNLPNFLHSLNSENKAQRGATVIDGTPSIKPGSRPDVRERPPKKVVHLLSLASEDNQSATMSYNQVAIYKYGCQAQNSKFVSSASSERGFMITDHGLAAANNSIVVAQQFIPNSRILQFYRPTSYGPSRMASNYQPNNVEFTPEQHRKHVKWRQEKDRAEALGHILAGIPRDPEHEEWERQQEFLRAQGGEQSNFQGTFVRLVSTTM
jgi:hypothetical protein